jgi:ABC-type branched-subunit amino acid transport system substrate-binding protein
MEIIKKKSILIISLSILLASCSTPIKRTIDTQQTQLTRPILPKTPPEEQIKTINTKIKVAVLMPLSGKHKDLGEAMLNSVILSLFENDKDNNIELIIFDSKGNSSDSLKAIREIAKQNVKVVIGPIFSTSVRAVSKVAKNNNITVLSFSNNQKLAGNPSIFLMGFLPEQQIERMVSYAISKSKNNFAILAPNNQYGVKFSSILKETVKRKDGNFITSNLYLSSNEDLEKTVQKMLDSYIVSPRILEERKQLNMENKDENAPYLQEGDKIYANVILVPESGSSLYKSVSLIKKYNITERNIQIIGSSNWDDISTLNNPDLIGGWFTAPDPDKFRSFERRYYQIYNKFPPRISSIGYDAALSVINTINESEGEIKTFNVETLINYPSRKNGFEGIDGLFRFLPNGIVQRNFSILEVENGKFDVIDSPSSIFFKY